MSRRKLNKKITAEMRNAVQRKVRESKRPFKLKTRGGSPTERKPPGGIAHVRKPVQSRELGWSEWCRQS